MTKSELKNIGEDVPPSALLTQTTDDPVDRPGCDFGGATGLTTAGLGIGLGDDSSDTRLERSLPGRRFTGKLSIPRWSGSNIKSD
ncbi:hypothetical protein [Sphingomonas sp.]|uniref:hypothetical protein n=1 Tax=Sphingomonas sp. TaxID=28214 RepID=UPI0025E6200E|nr:hypothetical protein [Sphingomonas sp.]